MAEKTDDLPIEASMITKDFLSEHLSHAQKKNVEIATLDVVPATKPGENFLSVVFRVRASTKESLDQGIAVYNLIIKVQQFNENVMKYALENRVFEKDIKTYISIVPEMERHWKNKTTHEVDLFPQCFGGFVNDRSGTLILEDLKEVGYRLASLSSGFDLAHCQLAMKAIAKFHALGYSIKCNSPDQLNKWLEFLNHESFFSVSTEERYSSLFKVVFKSQIDVARETEKNPNILTRLKTLSNMDIFKAMREAFDPCYDYATICHGDYWVSNIMFQYDSEGKPHHLKVIDFQLIRFAQPTTDLALFFYMATTPAFRRKHLHELLRLYHESLMESLRLLDVELPGYTFSVCEQEYNKSALSGFLTALMFNPLTKVKPEDVVDFDNPPDSLELEVMLRKAIKNSGQEKWMIDTIYEGLDIGFF